ncbi:MAG: hypothetical protein AB1486_22725, partial [Planctomycetota bacterium]
EHPCATPLTAANTLETTRLVSALTKRPSRQLPHLTCRDFGLFGVDPSTCRTPDPHGEGVFVCLLRKT